MIVLCPYFSSGIQPSPKVLSSDPRGTQASPDVLSSGSLLMPAAPTNCPVVLSNGFARGAGTTKSRKASHALRRPHRFSRKTKDASPASNEHLLFQRQHVAEASVETASAKTSMNTQPGSRKRSVSWEMPSCRAKCHPLPT